MELIIATPGATRDWSSKVFSPSKILDSTSNLFPTKGIDQSRSLARKLSDIPIDYIFSSKYNAATQTVHIIEQLHRPRINLNGQYKTKEILDPFSYSEKEKYFPKVQEFYDGLVETHADQSVLVVTFDLTARVLSCLAQGKSLEKDLGKIPLFDYGHFERFKVD